jgi:hypothetical protein
MPQHLLLLDETTSKKAMAHDQAHLRASSMQDGTVLRLALLMADQSMEDE